MKKFLYLRITAFIIIVGIVALLAFSIYFWIGHFNIKFWYRTALVLVIFAMFACQSVLILFIFRNYYPDKEISRTYKVCYHVSAIYSIIWSLVFIGGTVYDVAKSYKMDTISMLVLSVSIITTFIQFFGGRRLLKTIRRNARQQLENSFV